MERRANDTFQRDVLNTLGDIRVLCERNTSHQEAVSARVDKLEAAQTRQWWMTYVVTPCLFVAHAIARNMGAKI